MRVIRFIHIYTHNVTYFTVFLNNQKYPHLENNFNEGD